MAHPDPSRGTGTADKCLLDVLGALAQRRYASRRPAGRRRLSGAPLPAGLPPRGCPQAKTWGTSQGLGETIEVETRLVVLACAEHSDFAINLIW